MSASKLVKQRKVEQSFRRSLDTYDENAFVQLEIAQTLVKLLSEQCAEINQFNRVFEIGCGTGFLTKALCQNFQVNQFELNDLVAECEQPMLNHFQSLSRHNQVDTQWEFSAGDINEHEFARNYDLICSASTLQWVFELSPLVEKIYRALSDNAWLAISSFGQEHFSELSLVNSALGYEYASLNYLDESQCRKLFANHFELKLIQENSITLWFDSFEEILMHLRNTGVNGNSRKHWNQSQLKDFAALYQSEFMSDRKLPLTYKPIYIIAQKR